MSADQTQRRNSRPSLNQCTQAWIDGHDLEYRGRKVEHYEEKYGMCYVRYRPVKGSKQVEVAVYPNELVVIGRTAKEKDNDGD